MGEPQDYYEAAFGFGAQNTATYTKILRGDFKGEIFHTDLASGHLLPRVHPIIFLPIWRFPGLRRQKVHSAL